MIDHARTEALIASSIDYALPADAQAELADHLATCPSCRSLNAGYRSDAAGLRSIAHVEPPARVRSALKAAATRPIRRTIEPWKLLIAAALLLAALLGVATAIGGLQAPPQLGVVAPSAGPSAKLAATTPAPLASVSLAMTVRCGPLIDDESRCLGLVAATAGGLSSDYQAETITGVTVQGGGTRQWCAPPLPCISPPPDSYWVLFNSRLGTESIPVYGDGAGGWLLGVPDPSVAAP
jgi:hypothetical protein